MRPDKPLGQKSYGTIPHLPGSRQGGVEFLAKYVRPGKTDGAFHPEVSGREAVWNWRR